MRDERKEQIVDAFIELVAANGLEHVSLDDIAVAAGVQRTALRHYVGNRAQLITAALAEIARLCMADVSKTQTFTELIMLLFSPERIENNPVADRAWGELMPEGMRSPETCEVVKQAYDHMIGSIGDALRQECPDASRAEIADAAYAITCMVEYNFTFQRIGYPRARCHGLKNAAFALAEQLGSTSA